MSVVIGLPLGNEMVITSAVSFGPGPNDRGLEVFDESGLVAIFAEGSYTYAKKGDA